MTRFLRRSGTAICDRTSVIAPMYRGSVSTSSITSDRPSATTVPTMPWPTAQPEASA